MQSIDTPWEEIPEYSPSEGNPWFDFGNPSKECLKETLNQNLHIHNMANIPPPGGNQPPPPPGALPP